MSHRGSHLAVNLDELVSTTSQCSVMLCLVPGSSAEIVHPILGWAFPPCVLINYSLGIILLFKAARSPGILWSGRILGGGMLLGWGLFNVVEGLVDHYLLGIHHVVERLGLSIWDHLFIAASLIMLVVGFFLIRRASVTRT